VKSLCTLAHDLIMRCHNEQPTTLILSAWNYRHGQPKLTHTYQDPVTEHFLMLLLLQV